MSAPLDVRPAVLAGQHIRLEPLAREHAPEILAAAAHADIWRYIPFALMSPPQLEDYFKTVFRMQEQGAALAFVQRLQAGGALIGGTGYWSIDRHHRRVEIGGTWITPAHQRTAANTEAKYLLLAHAFETLGCMRVEFKTDALNEKSRAALARIGAQEEGTFRKHMVMLDGRIRDSVYFAVVDDEWPAVKARLEALLAR